MYFLARFHYFTVHNITCRALPTQFGNWTIIWKRLWRLSRSGVFQAFFEALASLRERAHLVQMFDSTIVRARGCGGCQRGQDAKRSGIRVAVLNKDHLKIDLDGHSIAFRLTGGEAALIRGVCPVILYRSNAKLKPALLAKPLYKARSRIEHTFGKLRRFKRVAMRIKFEKR